MYLPGFLLFLIAIKSMKKLLPFTISIFYLFFTTTCRKSEKNKDPELKTVSAIVNSDGTVLVTAEILSEGTERLENMGFCMDTLPSPISLNNQQIVNEPPKSQFSTVYSQKFNSDKTYYFWSWVKNRNGYTYGNKIRLSNIKAVPIEVPCSLNPNTYNIGGFGSVYNGSVYKVTGVEQSLSTSNEPIWNILATSINSPTYSIQITFNSEPRTKIYRSSISFNAVSHDFVIVHINSESYRGNLWEAKVYVNEKSWGVYDITICSGIWHANKTSGHYAFSSHFDTRFVSPLN